MLKLVLARHGLSYSNLDRMYGPDGDLTDLGRAQAALLGDWLAEQGHAFTALYCSPLRRARQTAQIVNEHFGLEIIVDADLREIDGPYMDAMPVRTSPLGQEPAPPFGPGYEGLRERVAQVTRRILDENPDGEVLVVAHGGTLGTMMRSILGTHALFVHTELAAVHCLEWDGDRWKLEYANRPGAEMLLSARADNRSSQTDPSST
jgi:broad specificity phosphatase PhoE